MVRGSGTRRVHSVDLLHSSLDIDIEILIMYTMEQELLRHIEAIAWDNNVPDSSKIASIQALLYQWGANQDHKTEELFGDDDAHIHSPNMRRM